MKKDKRNRFRNRFSQTICKFFNIFTFCSRQSPSCIMNNSSYFLTTPAITRSNIFLSQPRIDPNHLKLSFYPTFDQTCQREPISLSSTSNCQSSLTIHQCYSTNIIPSATTTTNIEILTSMEKPSSPRPTLTSRFSYLIRPSTPCVFGREHDDDNDDDEFFVTAGGIIHSCPNIYELSIDNHRKLQSCDHLMFIDQQTRLTDINNNKNLNSYDTEFDRYSILPRFQPIPSSISTDSINSELELYRERHAIGLSRQCHENISTSSSFLPTTWKSDNYLLFMPVLHHHSSLFNLMDHGKRSRSYDVPIEQRYSTAAFA